MVVRFEALAERDPRRAGMYAQRAIAACELDGAGLLAAGWALLRWERIGEAVAALSKAEALLSPHEVTARLRCRRALLMARQQSGEGQSLQADWEAYAGACEAADAWGELARGRCEQVAHLNLLGRPTEARALAERIHTLVKQHGTLADVARHQYVAGVAAVGCADLDAALRQLDAAHELFVQLRRPAEVARASIERAWLWLRREQLERAEDDLLKALAICQRLDLPLRAALCRRDLGLVARYRGDYGQAVAWLVAAQEQFVALGRLDRAAHCDFNLGTVAHMTGLLELAGEAYRRAEHIFTTLDDQFHALVAARNQAMVLCAQDQAAEALALTDNLIAHLETLGDQLELAELRAVRAQALRRLGRRDEAAVELQATHQLFLQLGNSPAAGECQLELAWLLLEQDAPADANAYLRAAALTLEQRPAHRWRVHYGLGRAAEALGDGDAALVHYAEAVQTVSRLRQQLVSEHASSQIFSQARHLHQDALRLAAARNASEQLLVLAEAQRGLVFGQQLRALASGAAALGRAERAAVTALQTSLRGETGAPDLARARNAYIGDLIRKRHRSQVVPVTELSADPAQLQERLNSAYGSGWTVLCPIFNDDQLLLAGLTPQGFELTREPFDRKLRHLVTRASQSAFRLHVYRDLERLQDSSRLPWEDLRILGRRLVPGWLCERLAPDHRLFIVPSGPLHTLPWAALQLSDGWLCERAVIEMSPTLGQVPGMVRSNVAGPALLMGCDNFGERASPLPGALTSLELVAAHWQGEVRRLVGPQATSEALRGLSRSGDLQRYQLLHLASHAQLGQADGLLAHIKLADDDLFLEEILQLRLDGALVVLATCEGGAGAVLPGDEVLGLSRALLAAGAASVLANLWPIYDRGTLAFLEPLYRALGSGVDAATALATSQRALIHTPAADASAGLLNTPLIWGGFNVTSRWVEAE